ncbi:hypothetical protein GCM10027298_14390 [Epidermidibacterium keratini]
MLDERVPATIADRAPSVRARRTPTIYPLGAVVIVLTAIALIVAGQLIRTPWGLPGHRTLFWLAPMITARLAIDRANVGTGVAAASSAIILTANPMWGLQILPYLIAGVVLDRLVPSTAVRRAPWLLVLAAPLIASVNLIAPLARNLQTAPLETVVSSMWFYVQGHLLWGLAAGVLGTALGLAGQRGLARLSDRRGRRAAA